MRANKRNARIMVYEVLVGADAGSPFGSSALCVSQANVAETLSIKVCHNATAEMHSCTESTPSSQDSLGFAVHSHGSNQIVP